MSTIVDRAVGDPQFSILVTALQYVDAELPGSNLVATLSAPSSGFTVFAPTNSAFGLLALDLGFDGDQADANAVTAFLVGAVPPETLRDVLLYHVAAGILDEGLVSYFGSITTLQGGAFTLDGASLVDAEPDLANPTLIATDIFTSNGVIHAIDRVLLPIDLPGNEPTTEPAPNPDPDPAPELSSIAGIVASSGDGFDANGGDFDMLLAAVKAAGLVGALADETATLTAFAPTDEAFVTLSQTLGYGSSDEAGAWEYLVDALTLLGGGDPIPLLTTVLQYHVAPGALDAAAVLGSTEIGTLAGASFGVSGTTLVDADPDLANPNIIATDILASNGIVHAIDGVLLPADLLQSDGSNDVDFVIGSDEGEKIWTGKDADLIDGNGGRDFIYAGKGDDVAFGGAGNDIVAGNRGNDLLSGDEGHDRIYGGSGDDTVSGGSGNDVMYGGKGNDVFVFGQGDGHDVIADFRNQRDKIDVSDFGFSDYHELRENVHAGFWRSTIELGDDNITVKGLTWWNISEDDFIL